MISKKTVTLVDLEIDAEFPDRDTVSVNIRLSLARVEFM